MCDKDNEFDRYESHKYQKLLPLNSPHSPIEHDLLIQSEELSVTSIDSKDFRNGINPIPNSSELSTLHSKNLSTISTQNLTKSHPSRLSSLSDAETTKSTLIQCILDSFKPTKSSSYSTTNSSLSSIDETTTIPCQSSLNLSNKITINFKHENELGINPHIDDLLEKIESNKNCSCHQIDIIFNNPILNQQLPYKQKQSILRIILRRQQIFDRYFSIESNSFIRSK